ncbi:Metallo-dependent phosphatase [Earliella scabrosa]|nr:Metallo-dependent phosphatase [Earliella scabrosa]
MVLFALFALLVAVPGSLAVPTPQDLDFSGLSSRTLDGLTLVPYPLKPRLTFRNDGTFKITVFSDLHMGENPWDWWGPEHDASSVKLMNTVLASEKPDYAVINGDLVTGENTFRENSTRLIDQIVGPLNKFKVPFSSTHGNHDNQPNISHAEEIRREQQVARLSYTRSAPSWADGEGYGSGTYWVPVYTKPWDFRPSLILWFFDSRGGFSLGANSTRVPDHVHPSVATWIERTVSRMNAFWGPADKVGRGSIAFMHIPPNVAEDLQQTLNSTTNPGMNADRLGEGSTQASNPQDAGKDEPFWAALNKHVLNLHAVISGHDHGNEWCKRDTAKDVIFCFNKHSGYGGYTRDGWGHGVRNIVFRNPDPRVGPETWIRMEDGQTHARIILDRSYN